MDIKISPRLQWVFCSTSFLLPAIDGLINIVELSTLLLPLINLISNTKNDKILGNAKNLTRAAG